MNRKLIFLLYLTLGFLAGCSDPIENNSRVAFELNVVNGDDQPLQDVEVSASFFNRTSVFFVIPILAGFEGIVGVGSTNDLGELSLISLEPQPIVEQIAVLVNSNERLGGNPINEDYGVVIYQLDSLTERTTVLPTTILRRRARLELEIIDNPLLDGTLDFTLTYATPTQQFQITSGEELTEETIRFNDQQDSIELLGRDTLQNTIATFSYTITSATGTIETSTIEIPINEETVEYVFEF